MDILEQVRREALAARTNYVMLPEGEFTDRVGEQIMLPLNLSGVRDLGEVAFRWRGRADYIESTCREDPCPYSPATRDSLLEACERMRAEADACDELIRLGAVLRGHEPDPKDPDLGGGSMRRLVIELPSPHGDLPRGD